MKYIPRKVNLPKPWYHASPDPEKQLEQITAFPKREARTMRQCEAVLLDAGFSPKQIAALHDVGAIKP